MEHSHKLCGPTALFFDVTAGDKVTTVIRVLMCVHFSCLSVLTFFAISRKCGVTALCMCVRALLCEST
jgi:hypothetical protein